jgi:hypothetical protein
MSAPPSSPPSSSRKQRTELSLSRKQEIFEYRDANPEVTQVQIACKFSLDKTTVSKLFKQRGQWEAIISKTTQPLSRTRIHFPPFYVIELALLLWFRETQTTNPSFLIDDAILLNQAQTLADLHQLPPLGTSITPDWLGKWKRRNNIVFAPIQGESASSDLLAGDMWLETGFADICARYRAEDIWNCDETGLYWRRLPHFALTERGKKLKGIKLSKDRITVLLCCSMTGAKFLTYIIGTSEAPRRFSSLIHKPFFWGFNKSAWMTRYWFSDFLTRFNAYARSLGRKFALIMDNCSCHKVDNDKFTNLELAYLPPNCTSTHQPLDQGVIANFKVQFKKQLVAERLAQVKRKKMKFRLEMSQCVTFVGRAWARVTPKVIVNCFRHAKFIAAAEPGVPAPSPSASSSSSTPPSDSDAADYAATDPPLDTDDELAAAAPPEADDYVATDAPPDAAQSATPAEIDSSTDDSDEHDSPTQTAEDREKQIAEEKVQLNSAIAKLARILDCPTPEDLSDLLDSEATLQVCEPLTDIQLLSQATEQLKRMHAAGEDNVDDVLDPATKPPPTDEDSLATADGEDLAAADGDLAPPAELASDVTADDLRVTWEQARQSYLCLKAFCARREHRAALGHIRELGRCFPQLSSGKMMQLTLDAMKRRT